MSVAPKFDKLFDKHYGSLTEYIRKIISKDSDRWKVNPIGFNKYMDPETMFYNDKIFHSIEQVYNSTKRIGNDSGFGEVHLAGDFVIKKVTLRPSQPGDSQFVGVLYRMIQEKKKPILIPNSVEKDIMLTPNYISEMMVSGLLNEMKEYTPGFVNTIGFQLKHDVYSAYQVMEKLEPKPPITKEPDALWYAFEMCWALAQAQEKFRYCHFDLHGGNVLSRKIDKKRAYKVGDVYLQSTMPFETVIVDYGFSRLEVDDKVIVGVGTFTAGHFLESGRIDILDYYNFNPYVDVFSAIGGIENTSVKDYLMKKLFDIPDNFSCDINKWLESNVRINGSKWRADPLKIASLNYMSKAPKTPREMVDIIADKLFMLNDPRITRQKSVKDDVVVYKPYGKPQPFLMYKTVEAPIFKFNNLPGDVHEPVYKIYRKYQHQELISLVSGIESLRLPNFVKVHGFVTGDCVEVGKLGDQFIAKFGSNDNKIYGLISDNVPTNAILLTEYLKTVQDDTKFAKIIFNIIIIMVHLLDKLKMTIDLNTSIFIVPKESKFTYYAVDTSYSFDMDVLPIFSYSKQSSDDYENVHEFITRHVKNIGVYTNTLLQSLGKYTNLFDYLRNLNKSEIMKLVSSDSVEPTVQDETHNIQAPVGKPVKQAPAKVAPVGKLEKEAVIYMIQNLITDDDMKRIEIPFNINNTIGYDIIYHKGKDEYLWEPADKSPNTHYLEDHPTRNEVFIFIYSQLTANFFDAKVKFIFENHVAEIPDMLLQILKK